MRKMKRKIAFCSIFVLSLALMTLAMPYVLKMVTKSSANSDPDVGKISYFKADLFDYESSKRSANGNFLLGDSEFKTDAALFLFNQENYDINPATFGQTTVPLPSEHNSWIRSYKYKIAQGLVENSLDAYGNIVLANNRIAVSGTQKVELFQTNDSMTFKGSYSFPFENVGNGYLQYDSSKNHVQVTNEVGDDKLLKMERFDKASNVGFMPFNKLDTSSDPDENGHYALSGGKNYYFGMKLELPFVMPKDGKITTYSGTEEDMVFDFSGDDDIWVFVDDKLVLDLGGIHDQVSGNINFATGVVTTTGNHYDVATRQYSKTATSVTKDSSYVKTLSVGRHKLQVFFLERGGAVSNCKITFRLQEDKTPEDTKGPEDIVGPETSAPTETPVVKPTIQPTVKPTVQPTVQPTVAPTQEPTKEPEVVPTEVVTKEPEVTPTEEVTKAPEVTPAVEVTQEPEATQVAEVTKEPGDVSDVVPTQMPVVEPTEKVTGVDDDNKANVPDNGGKPSVGKDTLGEETQVTDKKNNKVSTDDEEVVVKDEKRKESTKAKTNNNKIFSVFDSKTPLGFLPKTGTISGVIFYIVGASLIIAAILVLVFYFKKHKSDK